LNTTTFLSIITILIDDTYTIFMRGDIFLLIFYIWIRFYILFMPNLSLWIYFFSNIRLTIGTPAYYITGSKIIFLYSGSKLLPIMIGSDNYEENDRFYPVLDCHRYDHYAIHHEWNLSYMYYHFMLIAWI